MNADASRRFTDREIAIVLKKAAEIDESEGTGATSGLSIEDLNEIARSVGISPDAISKAVRGLEHRPAQNPLLKGAPLVRRSVHAVAGELNKEAVTRLIRRIDEQADAAGSISEALGSVRWTSAERFKSTQVSITPEKGETRIQVVEKIAPALRRVMHILPAAWGAGLAGAIVASSQMSGPVSVVIGVLGFAAGAGIGRAVYTVLSARSSQRVERLAADLARDAHDASKMGLLEHPTDSAK